jgi:hypothetical protein
MDDKAKAVARYESYIEEVKAAVPASKLLVFKVDEGWGPLCAFLGVSRPDAEFPNLNDRAAIKKIIRNITKGTYFVLAGVAAAVSLVIGGAYWFLR